MKPTRTVALLGVTPLTLILGRALALQDNPALGLHDPDPQAALRASLFLGLSAWSKCEQLLQAEPKVILCTQPELLKQKPEGTLVIYLCTGSQMEPGVCWATVDQPEPPTEISNALPDLLFSLNAEEATAQEAKAFLEDLSASFKCA